VGCALRRLRIQVLRRNEVVQFLELAHLTEYLLVFKEALLEVRFWNLHTANHLLRLDEATHFEGQVFHYFLFRLRIRLYIETPHLLVRQFGRTQLAEGQEWVDELLVEFAEDESEDGDGSGVVAYGTLEVQLLLDQKAIILVLEVDFEISDQRLVNVFVTLARGLERLSMLSLLAALALLELSRLLEFVIFELLIFSWFVFRLFFAILVEYVCFFNIFI